MSLTDSQFYMWRAVFAIVHVDHVVSAEEIRFMAEVLEDVPFSPEQKAVLEEDAKYAQDVDQMFEGITDPVDQMEFFEIARKLAHIDGDFADEEQKVLTRLQTMHAKETNVDDLVGQVDLQLEDEQTPMAPQDRDVRGSLYSFRQNFLKKLSGA